ncbi:MAG TPA: methionyl-tRNA formyltransferase [Terracidiphilus sp.]|nr:methionyl-tRNA formyltransferase [Terracidiphilus sp.]
MAGAATRLRLVFCGTPEFAVPTLKALIVAGHDLRLVVSQPDRPVGREHQIAPTPVKRTALEVGLPVMQPEKIRNNEEFRARLEAAQPDAIVVVAYGRIIPPWMLALPRLGCVNLHASLLPKYRGAAPIQWAVAMGDACTGNTTMLLEEGLDTGPILMQKTHAIGPKQTAAELFPTLAEAGAPLVVETLDGLANGTVHPRAQNPEAASYAPMLTREDGRMDFSRYTEMELYNRWRGFQPWPGAFTALDGKKLIVHRMAPAGEFGYGKMQHAECGELQVENGRLFVACAQDTWLELVEVQLEGKKRLSAAEFLRGTPKVSKLVAHRRC